MEAPRVKHAAIVHPSRAPTWQRWSWYGASAVLFLVGCLMLNTFPIAPKLLTVATLLWLISPLVLRRSKYKAEIETAPGEVCVRPRFGVPFRIATSSLRGASIASADEIPFVTVIQRSASQTTVELERGTSTDEIRRVLGVPTGGFGILRWEYEPRPLEYFTFLARLLGAVAVGISLLGTLGDFVMAGLVAVLVAGIGSTYAAISSRPVIILNSAGVAWNAEGDRAATYVEFVEIDRVDDDGHAISIHASGDRRFVLPCVPTEWIASGLREGERNALVAQLRAAVARSKGRVRVDEAAAYASQLARGEASSTEWLARIDALATSHANAPPGYRGSTIPAVALWRILEDHDVDPASRAAAARVLYKTIGENAANRIAEAIDSTHDDVARSLMRTVLGEDARRVLEEIEREARLAGELTR